MTVETAAFVVVAGSNTVITCGARNTCAVGPL